ncbi:MAG: ATP-dependent zinc protease [Pseudomonadaceae bacterium]|nr:ATP-dependent zinc protease [Pseudomonadaceae bacterium]
MINTKNKTLIGSREVIFFPQLGITLRAKIDTGAKTSSLHATHLQVIEKNDQEWVSFTTLTEAKGKTSSVHCEFPVYDHRQVRSSNGQAHWRYVIEAEILLGKTKQKIELTLADRSKMQYPMLLGRTAMNQHFLVAPGKTYLQGSLSPFVSLENKCT